MAKTAGKCSKIYVQHKVNNCAHTINFVLMERDLHLLGQEHTASLEINGFQYSHKQMVINGFRQVHVAVANAIHYRHIMEVREVGWKVQHINLTKNGIFVVDHQNPNTSTRGANTAGNGLDLSGTST